MSTNSNENVNNNMELLDALSLEINDIMTINELTLQKSVDLNEQIVVCESRQEYIYASLTESEKIAEEITSNAAQRVLNIIARTQNIIETQREQIAFIEQEIAELNREIDISEETLSAIQKDFPSSPQPVVCLDFSLQEPQELDNPIEQPETIEIDQSELLMHLDTFVDTNNYETKDTSNEQLDNPSENQTLIEQVQAINTENVLPGKDFLQALREILSAREVDKMDKPDISFKQKLGQIFKTRN